jgi:hypothetical protein
VGRGNLPPSRSFVRKPRGQSNGAIFFHVKNGSTFKGEEGENYPNLETARAHAAKIASELAKETGYEGFALSVTDEQGNEVAYMPIGEAAN